MFFVLFGDCSVRVVFWLLDINPKVAGDQVELWLWGIDETGKRVLIVERNFTAYFYAVLHGGADAPGLVEAIMTRYGSLVAKVEVVGRRFFGKPVTAIKVSCRDANETGKVARQLRKLDGVADCLEDDVRVAMRYLIDNGVVPCSWHEVEVAEEEARLWRRVMKVYAANSPPKLLDNAVVPSLRILGFSMICYSREVLRKPDRNPVLMISVVSVTVWRYNSLLMKTKMTNQSSSLR